MNKPNFKVELYCAYTHKGKYMVRDTSKSLHNIYLLSNGCIINDALLQPDGGNSAMYATKECAEQALANYNNKGSVMKKCDLKTGMVNARFRDIGSMDGRWYVDFRGYSSNVYLCTDGVLRQCSRHDATSTDIWYDTKECAKQALANYNNKGSVLKKCDLKTGMGVIFRHKNYKDNIYYVALNTPNGDILVDTSTKGYMELDSYTDDLLYSRGYSNKEWDIVEVFDIPTNRCLFNNVGNTLWQRPVAETVMTISEIENKYGISNLKIKGGM
jgi:hypothetical protein